MWLMRRHDPQLQEDGFHSFVERGLQRRDVSHDDQPFVGGLFNGHRVMVGCHPFVDRFVFEQKAGSCDTDFDVAKWVRGARD
jgi:hypothetical protein